jgi:hypothetical protein
MSDRTSCRIFADLFRILDEHPNQETAREIAQSVAACLPEYDFDPSSLAMDEALKRLGLDDLVEKK